MAHGSACWPSPSAPGLLAVSSASPDPGPPDSLLVYSSSPVVLKVGSLDQQHWHHLELQNTDS